VAPTSKPDPEQSGTGSDRQTWFRSSAAVSVAGLAGIALIIALVVTVVRMSDQWSSPPAPTMMTSSVPTTQQTLRSTEPFIATPSYGSSTFPTSVDLSTTDIGIPGDTTTTTTDSSESESPTSRTTRTTRAQNDDETGDQTTTTRKRPRLNETRTLSP